MTPTNRTVVLVTDYLLYAVQNLHDILVSSEHENEEYDFKVKHGKFAFTLLVDKSRADCVVGVGP